ncbi:MAG: FAD-dependent oxidoreductase, partial [Acidimicrobiia bacterium]|nr:FAD-dependent oxidoreductase [Acidimicrobiia bacterium]
MMHRHDLLVIGGGPGGAATGYWAAQHGLDVVIVERKRFPREKTCGDGLTPRAVRQLHDMGLRDRLEQYHRCDGLRAVAHDRTLELAWPDHPEFPNWGHVVKRSELDTFVADHAVAAGAVLHQGSEATAPLFRQGLLAGASVLD